MFIKVWNDIKKGNIAPVYCLVGEETYFIDETITRLKRALGNAEEVETTMFDLEESPVDVVIDEADTFPFFSDKKLIIAKNASFLKASEKGKEKIDHDLNRLENWLKNPSDFAVMVFIAPYEKLDERKKITKQMKQSSVLLVSETLQENDLNVWIQSEVSRFGKAITDDAIDKLVEMVGTNMLQLQKEIEKIALYLGEDLEITTKLVEDLVAKTLEHDAFKMLNAYLSHNNTQAIQIYHDLLRQKEEPIMLVGLLASNIRTMNNVFYLQKKGYHPSQIAKQLKIHPYRVKLMVEQKNKPSEERLLKALHKLSEIDLMLKSVSGNRERYLEMFLLKAL
ncbi:DNA polymerase III subunit delta [Ureibacillus massiliensis 4400831 = CIP 108448 = CCUG 49529]|uniref:DNA polymerase III subunit delta n=1 Tax=Ureibacillus massiliensis 4400831 = CIP 108448 = CCUG 49529 TaxID=1211035 RepID=A0A0A3J134_9BACL|nr:DNA polymerase III subunit delta [Ureibacillus massiliensis]KGR90714.1 DNA polymerase III subunit delta [Ureibacillus massiliensis 4400831 = CIP 108448 = CCUG 49529]